MYVGPTTITTRKQGLFLLGNWVPQMAPIWIDKGAILDESFSTQPLWLGYFGGLFGWFLWLDFLIFFFD